MGLLPDWDIHYLYYQNPFHHMPGATALVVKLSGSDDRSTKFSHFNFAVQGLPFGTTLRNEITTALACTCNLTLFNTSSITPIMKQNNTHSKIRRLLPHFDIIAKYAAWRRQRTGESEVSTEKTVERTSVHYPILLLDLPFDILVVIFPLLSILSQACLALTCKSLYSLCGHVLKDNSLAWPRMSRTYEPLLSQPELLRNQFLFRLENDRWLYCAGCLKLHPRHRFGLPSDSPEKRQCKYHSGIVDLCPCIALTFFDRLRLEESLREGAFDTSLPLSIRTAFEFSISSGKRCLMHQCSITYHADALVYMTVVVSLDVQRLEVQKTCRLHLSRPWRARAGPELRTELFTLSREMEPILLCPHFDLLKFLYGPYDWGVARNNNCACNPCNAYIVGPKGAEDGRYITVRWRQNLGGPTDTMHWYCSSRSKNQTYRRDWYLRHGDIYFDTAQSVPSARLTAS